MGITGVTEPKALFRPVDRVVLAVIGVACVIIGGFLLFDETAAGQVWLRVWWPPLILFGGLLHAAYSARPSIEWRPYVGTILPIALAGRGFALVMGIVDGTAASWQRAVALCALWVLAGFVIAAVHLIYLPLPGLDGPRQRR